MNRGLNIYGEIESIVNQTSRNIADRQKRLFTDNGEPLSPNLSASIAFEGYCFAASVADFLMFQKKIPASVRKGCMQLVEQSISGGSEDLLNASDLCAAMGISITTLYNNRYEEYGTVVRGDSNPAGFWFLGNQENHIFFRQVLLLGDYVFLAKYQETWATEDQFLLLNITDNFLSSHQLMQKIILKEIPILINAEISDIDKELLHFNKCVKNVKNGIATFDEKGYIADYLDEMHLPSEIKEKTAPSKSIQGKATSEIVHFEIGAIEELQNRCDKYMTSIQNERTDFFNANNSKELFVKDISSIESVFSHLNVLSGYKLTLYSKREHHGVFGYVIAEKTASSPDELIKVDLPASRKAALEMRKIPSTAIDPFEAITGDGSPISFMEAVIALHLFDALPAFAFRHRYSILNSSPFEEKSKVWEVYTSLSTWQPICIKMENAFQIRMSIQKEVVKGLHSTDSSSHTYLCSYTYSQNIIRLPGQRREPCFPMKISKRDGTDYTLSEEQSILLGKELKEFQNGVSFSFDY